MKQGSDQAKQKGLKKLSSTIKTKTASQGKARFIVKKEQIGMIEPRREKEAVKMEEIPGNYQDMILQPIVIARQNTMEDEGCVAITSILSRSYEYDDDSDNQVDTVVQRPDATVSPQMLTTIETALNTIKMTTDLRNQHAYTNAADVPDSDESLHSDQAWHNHTSCNIKDSNHDPSFLFGTTGPISRLALQDACRQQQMTETGLQQPDVLSSTIFHSTISATSVIQMPIDEVTSVRGRFGEMAEFMNEIGASKNVMANEIHSMVQVEEKPKCYEQSKNDDMTIKLKLIERTVDYVPREMISFMSSAPSRITFLDISNCSIVELEGRIFMELKSLVRLNAQKNDIKYVSGKIGDCKFLEIIQLDRNCLESIPQELAELKNSLKTLKLSQNKLKSVNFGVKRLKKLEVLHLQNNCLKTLPQGFEQLQSLRELLLTDNPLQNFTLPVHKMASLQTVSLDWFQYLSPPLALSVQRTQFSKQQACESPSSPERRNSPLRKLYECVAEKEKGSNQKAGNVPPSLVADFSGRPQKTNSSPWRRDSLQPASLQTSLNNIIGNHQEPNKRVPHEFVKNDSKKPRKPDMFGKLIRFCMKSTSLQGLVDIDFMQFADHFNNPAFHAETTVNALDDKLRTMLHQAASKGATHIVSNLLQNGASTHLVDKYGFNAYGLAMREDQFQASFMILKSQNFPFSALGLGAGTFGSLMHLVIGKLQPDHLRLMLESEYGDPNFTEQKTSFNARSQEDKPLHILMSVYARDPVVAQQILKMLVQYGADVNCKNKELLTPLMCAVKRGYSQAVKDLLELSDSLEDTQQMKFVQSSPCRKTKFNKIEIDALGGSDSQSCLHFAAQMSYYDIVEIIVEHGADLLVRNGAGQTPLSSINNNLLMIKLLKKCEKEFFDEHFAPPPNHSPDHHQKFEDYLTDVQFLQNQHKFSGREAQPFFGKYVSLAETQRAMKSLQEEKKPDILDYSTNEQYEQNTPISYFSNSVQVAPPLKAKLTTATKKTFDEIADLTDSSKSSENSVHNRSMELLNRMLVNKGKSRTASEVKLSTQIHDTAQRERVHHLQKLLQVSEQEVPTIQRQLNNSQQQPSTPKKLLGPNISTNFRKSRQGSLQQRNSEVRTKKSSHLNRSAFEVKLNSKGSRLQSLLAAPNHDVYSQQMESPVRGSNAKIGKLFGSIAPSQSSAPAQQRKLIGLQCNSFSASKNLFQAEQNSITPEMDSSTFDVQFIGTERMADIRKNSPITASKIDDSSSTVTPVKVNFEQVKPKQREHRMGAGLINTSQSVITKASAMGNHSETADYRNLPSMLEEEVKNELLKAVKTPRMQQLFFQRFSSAESAVRQKKFEQSKLNLFSKNQFALHQEYNNNVVDSNQVSKSARSFSRRQQAHMRQPIKGRQSSVGPQYRSNIKVEQVNKKEVLKLKSIQSLKQLTNHIRSQQVVEEKRKRKEESELDLSQQYLPTAGHEEGHHQAKEAQMLMPVGRNVVNPHKSESMLMPQLPKFMPKLKVKIKDNIPLFFKPK